MHFLYVFTFISDKVDLEVKIMKKLMSLIIVFCVSCLVSPVVIYAQRGCCSHHGGQDYCASNGKWVCKDGSYSPTCRCKYVTNNETPKNNDSNKVNIPKYEDHVKEKENYNGVNDNNTYIENTRKNNVEDNSKYSNIIVSILGVFIVYKISTKKRKGK